MVSKSILGSAYLPSSVDQILTSAGNFLLIAIGAHYLGLQDQGKLAYVFSAYMFTVLANVATFFYAAPLVNSSLSDSCKYHNTLRWLQLFLSLVSSLLIVLFFILSERALSWNLSTAEVFLLFFFLFFQQLSDFRRREGYIFTTIYQSIKTSASVHIVRILFLLIFLPSNIYEFLLVLLFSSLLGSLQFLFELRQTTFKLDDFKLNSMSKHIALSKYSVINAPLNWIIFFLPVILVGILHSPKISGVLLSVRSLTGIANTLLEQLETIVPSQMSKVFHQGGVVELKKSAWMVFNFGLVVWIVVFLVTIYFGDEILVLFLGDKYSGNVAILLILWLGTGVHFLSRVLGLRWRVVYRPEVELFSSLGGVVILLLLVPLIASSGLLGGALTFMLIPLGMLLTQIYYISFIKK